MGEVVNLSAASRSGLGDVGPHDDESYGGQTGYGMDYLRDKAREFQVMLNALDSAYATAVEALQSAPPEDIASDMQAWLDDFDAHRLQLKGTAEAINAGAALINSLGGRFPQLSVPGTLGLVPAIPAAAVAWVAAAALAYEFGKTALDTLRTIILRWQAYGNMTPEQRGAAAVASTRVDDSIRAADTSLLGAASGAIKWAALVALGWLGWQALQAFGKRR